jgi:hypothetical protein
VLVLQVIRKYHLESRVILQSFDFRTLHAMKAGARNPASGALRARRAAVEIGRRRTHRSSRRVHW